jgi:hypothetical protein
MDSKMIVLTSEEEREISHLIPATSHAKSFAQLIDRWMKVIERIENGYKLGIFDYRNDLTLREIIERIEKGVSPKLRAKIASAIAPLDSRLSNATFISTNPPFPGALQRKPDAWWYSRLPRQLIGELAEDAVHEGLVSDELASRLSSG